MTGANRMVSPMNEPEDYNPPRYPAWLCIFYLWLPISWAVLLIAWLLGYDVVSFLDGR